jgi:hypothetical protein
MSQQLKNISDAQTNDEDDDVPDLLPMHFIHDEIYILIVPGGD